ncbi:lipopolysaccharide biosynthesis protein [Facklamia sp. HMSC062C11]|uniref:lipopolysaccharide biosynthesis protein n=1 Tax=Facklamia sp. HMSC062C11 TaxID=1739262 RepID=UPI0008A4B438|nr:lipopolysaccharide biosynthesis protein [Facklamia sp. HMSC062C11]OFL66855.1 lipopolysaccharide biosynthesis protein [Facklamia sp. HMSC062C11]
MNTLRQGIIYNTIGRYSNLAISIFVQVFLARLLSPAEFGIVAIVNVFLVFFQMLADFGIGPALIQRKDIDRVEINHIFSFSVYFSVILALIFITLSVPISNFYRNPELKSAMPLMSIVLLFNSLLMVPQNLLLKDKQFKFVNLTQILGSIVNGLVSIILALLGFSYIAIIIGSIARGFTQLAIFVFRTRLKFSIKFSIKPLNKIFSFAKNQLLFNIVNYFSRNLDNLLIGRYMSPDQLGFYDKAYQLTLYPNTIFTGVITSAIQPVFSDYQEDLSKIMNGYLSISRILANFSIPLTIFVHFAGKDIILLLYGDQWVNSVIVFQILSISIWIQMLQASTGAFFQSANRTDLLLLSGVLSTTFNVISIVIGVYLGSIIWIAFMVVISFSFNFIQTNYLLMNKAFNNSLINFFIILIKPIIVGVITLLSFVLLPNYNFTPFINLFIEGLIFMASLCIGLILTNQLKDALNLVKK